MGGFGSAQPHLRAWDQLPSQPLHRVGSVRKAPSGPPPGLAHYSSQSPAPERGQRTWVEQPVPGTWCSWQRMKEGSVGASGQTGMRSRCSGAICSLDHLRQAPYPRGASVSPFVYKGCPPRRHGNLTLPAHASPDIRHVHRYCLNNILTLSPGGGLCVPLQRVYRKPRLRDVKVLVQCHTPCEWGTRTLCSGSLAPEATSSNTGSQLLIGALGKSQAHV